MMRFGIALTLTALVGMGGCNKPSNTPVGSATKATNGHGHDSGNGTHDHSVDGHAHGNGPHDGTIADWGGGKYHVELIIDHGKQQATVYVLGEDEKTSTPIDADSIDLIIKDPELQLVLRASPQESDSQGKSSRFMGTHEKLGVVQEYAGTITGVVDDTPFSGDFNERAHGDHHH